MDVIGGYSAQEFPLAQPLAKLGPVATPSGYFGATCGKERALMASKYLRQFSTYDN